MAQMAPPGYRSNYYAIRDLVRFGFGIWTLPQMAALLFHAERSTMYGADSDQHSANQAMEGIFSSRSLEWVRGSSGLSPATWYRANNELVKAGVLRRIRRTTLTGKYDSTEFELDWTAIRSRIERWKETNRPGDSLSLRESKGEQTEKGISQPERMILSERENDSLTVRDTPQDVGEPTTTSWGVSLSLRDTVKSKSLFTVSQSQVAAAIEQAIGERPTDSLVKSLLQTAERLHLETPILIRWIHDKCFEKRAAGYPLRPGLLEKAISTDLIPWCKNNTRFIELTRLQAEQAQAKSEAKKHQQMPTKEQQADAEFMAIWNRDDTKAAG